MILDGWMDVFVFDIVVPPAILVEENGQMNTTFVYSRVPAACSNHGIIRKLALNNCNNIMKCPPNCCSWH